MKKFLFTPLSKKFPENIFKIWAVLPESSGMFRMAPVSTLAKQLNSF